MNFTTFWTAIETLEKSIAITGPVPMQVKRAFWGAPSQDINDLPCFINAMSEPERSLGFGNQRNQRVRISIQLLVSKSPVDNAQSSLLATAFWYAAKNAFDRDRKIGDTVALSTFRGEEPTVPVLLQHGGHQYIGFNAVLEIHDVEQFEF